MSEIIWESKIYDGYFCVVSRLNETTGHLVLTNVDSNEIILDQDVEVSPSGATTADIVKWFDIAKAAIAI